MLASMTPLMTVRIMARFETRTIIKPERRDIRTRGHESCLTRRGSKGKDQGRKVFQADERPRSRSVLGPRIPSRDTTHQNVAMICVKLAEI